MAIRSLRDGWQVDVGDKGRRWRALFSSHAEALLYEAQVRAALVEGREPPPPVGGRGAERRAVSLTSLLQDVCAEAAPVGWRGAKAEEALASCAGRMVELLGPSRAPAEITTATVDAAISRMEREGLASATINRRLAALSKMLRFAQRKGWVRELPRMERRREGQGRVRFLTREEEGALVQRLEHWGVPEAARLVVFLAETGARLGEAERLTWRDVSQTATTFWETKGGSPRTVPLTRRAAEAVWGVPCGAPDEPVFTVGRRKFQGLFARATHALNLPGVVVHTLRHTCASRLVQAGVDLRRVQQWMGHRAIQVTLRYAHLCPADLHSAAAALDRSPVSREPSAP